jgi:type II secretory ATPase GspE/PulE/Tfp pilus assembly ATPase PilB-like protein
MTNEELDDRLAELLGLYKVATPAVIERARAFKAVRRSTLAGALAELHLADSETLQQLLEEITGVRAVDPSLMTVYPDFVESMNALVPPDVVASLLVFPAQAELKAIHVCMVNPTDGQTWRMVETLSGCRVLPAVTNEMALAAAIERHYGLFLKAKPRLAPESARATAEAAYRELLAAPFDTYVKPALTLVNRNRDRLGHDDRVLEEIVRSPVIIRLVQQILARAVEAGASDIHVEPVDADLRIRVRVDGVLRIAHVLPNTMSVPLIGRLKVLADLPLDPAPVPLDSRISHEIVWGRAIDLRFSLIPSVSGDKAVLRVLDRSRERRQLTDLGLTGRTLSAVTTASSLPNGLLLVTGPTGSGKSATLYALLDRLNDPGRCILTAEDPVESRISGVTQLQCQEVKGLSFATALRGFLRQDPDVIMVGEIRDAETADMALKAALTGHLVLSTLHTNDAAGAVLRLLNMGLEPFLVASALRLIVAQRLVRRLCQRCKGQLAPESNELRMLARSPEAASAGYHDDVPVYGPVGCEACGGTGYRGRTGIFEALRITESMEELIVARTSTAEVRTRARAEGMLTLREDGWRRVFAGDTSVAEVLEHTVSRETEDDGRSESTPAKD